MSKGSYATLQHTRSYDRLQLYGPAQLQIKTPEQFNIVSGASHGWTQRFTLSGHAVSWFTQPAPAYIGLPKAVPVSTAQNDIELEEQLLRGFSLYLSRKPHDVVT